MNAQEALEWYDEAVDHVTDYLGLDREEQQAAWNALQSAIDQYAEPKPDEVQRAIVGLERHDPMNGSQLSEDIDFAIQVLSQMKPQEPCEWCVDLGKYKRFGYAEHSHQVAADEIIEQSIEVHFCPNCGRSLKGE